MVNFFHLKNWVFPRHKYGVERGWGQVGGGRVMHDDNNNTYMTPSGRPGSQKRSAKEREREGERERERERKERRKEKKDQREGREKRRQVPPPPYT